MKQTVKAAAAVVGILAAAWLTFELLTLLLWTCYYAGIQM